MQYAKRNVNVVCNIKFRNSSAIANSSCKHLVNTVATVTLSMSFARMTAQMMFHLQPQ